MESINTGVEFYSNVKASEVEWVWYPYIPWGKITMLQGDPGEGKSTLIIHIAATLTKGGYLPDGQKIKKDFNGLLRNMRMLMMCFLWAEELIMQFLWKAV